MTAINSASPEGQKKHLWLLLVSFAVVVCIAAVAAGILLSTKQNITPNAADKKIGIRFSEDKRTLLHYDSELQAKKFVIPAGVTTIGNLAFYGCENLTSVTIPASVTSIGKKTFHGCPCEKKVMEDHPGLYRK